MRRGNMSAAPLKHETVQWVRRDGKTLLEETLPRHLWEKAGVIGYNGHFCDVVARLIKDPLLELHEYVRILLESGIQVPNMVLRVRSGAIDPRGNLPPFLLKMAGLSSTRCDSGRGLSKVTKRRLTQLGGLYIEKPSRHLRRVKSSFSPL